MEDMRCCNKTAIKMMQQLDEIGLIDRVRRGQGKPSIIYVKDFASVHFLKCTSYTSRNVDSSHQEVNDLHPSNTDKSNTDLIENQSINQSPRQPPSSHTTEGSMDGMGETYHACLETVKGNIEYDNIKFDGKEDMNEIDGLVEIIVEAICTSRPTVRVGGEDKPADVVKGNLLKLNREHIEYVLRCLRKNTKEIENIRGYLLTALYNAPGTMGHFYRAAVNHDLKDRPP